MDVVNLAEKLPRFTDEPEGTLDTGDVVNERTVSALDRL
jgi:hypothetical protein